MRISRNDPDTVAAPLGTYSHAVRVETAEGIWIYVSGQLALDPDGNLVGGDDLAAQTEQVFANLAGILDANGASFADVVKLQTFFTTLEGLEGSRVVRTKYLGGNHPASTAVRVAALLLPEALIEVDVVAVIPAG